MGRRLADGLKFWGSLALFILALLAAFAARDRIWDAWHNVHRTTGKPYRWELDQRLGAVPPDHPDHDRVKAELDARDAAAEAGGAR